MKKTIIGIISTLFILILMLNCTPQKLPKEPPKIAITIDNKELEYITAKNKWDGKIYDREDTFQTIIKKDIEIPYIEIGKSVIIDFKNNPPDEFTISDILIDENGKRIYEDERLTTDIMVEVEDGKCSFEIKKNFASGLSSIYIENKKDIRGFRMIASWDKNECEYAFIIKTDAF